MAIPMNVLALSNERVPGSDPDINWALERLRARGVVGKYRVLAPPQLLASSPQGEAIETIAAAMKEIDAQVVIFFNSGSCLFDAPALERLRDSMPAAVWLYSEGDAFSLWALPLPRRALETAGRCAAAFLPSDGYLARRARAAGCPYIAYTPSWVNTERFPMTWQADGERLRQVVFVGNNVRSVRRRIPGARERYRLVKTLKKRFGDAFEVFGAGWGSLGSGPCRFEDIPRIYSESQVCIGIDHVVGRYQFSNRLPIAFAIGVPMLRTQTSGVAEVFPELAIGAWPTGWRGVADSVERLLGMSPKQLAALSVTERHCAERVSCDAVLGYMLTIARSILADESPATLPNPWISKSQLAGLSV